MSGPTERAPGAVAAWAPAHERSDAQWLEQLRCAARSSDAARDLRALLRRKLCRVLGRRGLDEHELDDVLQGAIVRIVTHLDSFRGDGRFTTWATAVAVREAFGLLRRRRRERALGDLDRVLLGGADACHPLAPAVPAPVGRRDITRVLRTAIDEQLTERQRAAVLGELAGVPSEELARRLGTNRNALYKLHHDARRKLRKAIRAAGFSDEEVRRELADASEGPW